jgi:glycosyltransferase involved in cell wall biosynthesis
LELELNDKIEKYGLSENIKLIPFSNSPEEHFIWSKYVVVPSTKPEPFGRVAIEAFSAKKPVIAANHGGLAEIVDHKINGFLFEANNVDDLVKILEEVMTQDRDEYNELSDNAYLKFEKCFSLYNYQHSIQEILAK